ncbi:zinc-dependent metalloprotease [Bacteroidota bacterium]
MKFLTKFKQLLLSFLILSFVFGSVFAQEDDAKAKKPKEKFKKYEEVIPDTITTITKEGIFTTHEVDDKLYYEISESLLGKEFLWIEQISKTQTGYGNGGTEIVRRVVRWERYKDQILLRNVEHKLRADKGTPEDIGVQASTVEEIIKAFDIVTFGENKTPVIEVTGLFKDDTPEFSPKGRINASSIDKTRTFISSVKSFKQNIETRVLATFKLKPASPTSRGGGGDSSLGSVTVELHHSMIELPERPMLPRIFDSRVGFFAGTHQDFSSDKHQVEDIKYIRRWRLEKKNPDQEVSEPVKPIVYYVGRAIPEKWQKYVKEGIEMWQPVFEKAGFKNAIIGKIAPSVEENPDFDAEDVRYSTIRWLPSTIANAMGPHVQDPRTGEILEADIRVWHNVLSLIRDWYFVQASPSNPEAQQLPLPDKLMGECLRYVIAHEVGHTLGMRHNFKATYYYDVEKYRDPEFTKKYGLEASIMDYGRFNYIAQPGDGASTIPCIAPYDYFAIDWAYREFKGTKTAEDDIPYLNKIADKQLDEPMFRFGGGYENGAVGGGDPHARSEDLGNDPIKATSYGLKNIEYITGYLVKASTEKDKDYTLLNHMYDALLGQYSRELGQVAALIGGIEIDNLVYGQSANVFTPTSAIEQKAAVDFILDKGFHTPEYLIKEDIITRIGMHGITNKISSSQKRLLSSILSVTVANRMLDLEATGFNNYSLVDLIEDLKRGVFEELEENKPEICIYRRNLQRAFVEQLIKFGTGTTAAKNDLQAIARGTLKNLNEDFKKQIKKGGNGIEYFHFVDLSEMIEIALENK